MLVWLEKSEKPGWVEYGVGGTKSGHDLHIAVSYWAPSLVLNSQKSEARFASFTAVWLHVQRSWKCQQYTQAVNKQTNLDISSSDEGSEEKNRTG